MPQDDFDLSEYDYIVGALAGFCMSDITKEMLWVILNHSEDSFDLLTAMDAQEDLIICVENYYTKE